MQPQEILYYKDLQHHKVLSLCEEKKYLLAIRKGDKQAVNKLIQANLKFVVSVAKCYQNKGLSLLELIGAGNLGLCVAAKKYSKKYKNRFTSYAVWWIRQNIVRAIIEQAPLIRIPYHKAAIVNQYKHDLSEGEDNEEKILKRKKYNKYKSEIHNLLKMGHPVSLDRNISRKNTREDDRSRLVNLLKYESDIDKWMGDDNNKTDMEKIFKGISKKERTIVEQYFGIGYSQPYTLEQIGEQFDLTKERVRQIKRDTIRRMKLLNRRQRKRHKKKEKNQ